MKKILIFLLITSTFSFAGGNVLYSLDFTKQKDGDAKAWLRSKGFKFMLEASKLSMKFKGGKLVISTSGEYAGMIGVKLPSSRYLKNIGSVKIVWGVDKFPKGADWAGGNNRLAIGALIALGTEKLSSGLPLGINAAPPFFGPFIGEKERVGGRYLGKLYKKGGRYYCVSNKNSGATVTTHFGISQKYQQEFKKPAPPVTAFAFQMNTEDTSGGAQAFIKSITFYSK
ncbi:hypothetical protein [Sulfurovum sp. NBC37-1]|uniref:hypothetical protein n=1 Tax=Sulfurovum sp. (strain NBC37-1) TaxID=387093 RepID=UPI0001587A72|nr:hypothetical protein [Sulfurovum sp. NBC37-1]BAF73310.1 hypothetical protein SUN_2374 [Sulfurovum sp. NBC37-1]